jgi:hypothetical protein
LKGFCPAGDDCKLKHFIEKNPDKPSPKPEADGPAEVVMREKKIAPAKPKRKSLCQTPAAMWQSYTTFFFAAEVVEK